MGDTMRLTVGVGLNIRTRIIDTEDGVIFDKTDKAHSFVNNFAYFLKHCLDGIGNSDGRSITNAAVPVAHQGWHSYSGCCGNYAGMDALGGAGDVTRGIVVGSSATPFAIAQYNMQALIGHGNGSGQLYYAATPTTVVPVFSDPNITFLVSRDFTNNYSTPIVVREIGIRGNPVYAQGNVYTATMQYCRDVVPEMTVGPAQVLNVQYILRTVM